MDRFDFGISQEDYFIFNETVPTLKEMAALNFAKTLCDDILHHVDLYDDEVDEHEDGVSFILNFDTISSEAEHFLNKCIIPQNIKDLIIKFCKMIDEEIYYWTKYNCSNIFDENKFSLRLFHVEFLVWKQNGKIDYEKTARKMLSHPRFSQVEKFKLMCDFCWEDEMQKLVPGVELRKFMDDMMKNSNEFDLHPHTYYWVCKFNNQLHRIPAHGDFDSLEQFMVSQDTCSLASVMYFLKFFNERDKVPIVIKLLKYFNDIMMKPIQKPIMSELNEKQKHSVLSQIPHVIVANFINSSDFEAASFLWTRMENSASDDMFVILLKKILKKLHYEENFSFMVQLWNIASDRHKNYFLYDRTHVLIDLFFNLEEYTTRDSSLSVLGAMLSFSTPAFKRNIILDQAVILFTAYEDCSKVNKIIEFCLPSSDDVVEFRNRLQKSAIVRNHFSGILCRGDFAVLIDYLKSYVYFESTVKHYLKQILEQDEIEFSESVFIFDTFTWSNIKDLLKMVYGKDTSTIKSVMKKFIFSFKWRKEYEMDAENKIEEWKEAIRDFTDMTEEVEESSME